MDRRFISMLVVAAVVLGGVFFFTKSKDSGGTSAGDAKPTSHIKGEGKKGVTLIEYGDFQCPACYQFEPLVKEVVSKYSSDITFQFRNYPLDNIHQNARAAHRAAEAAGLQGKFWEMHDKLYSDQPSWAQSQSANKLFEGFAQSIGLDMDRYKKDVLSSEVNGVINADKAEGEKLKITGTPAFFLDGKALSDLTSINTVEKFSALIDEAIVRKISATSSPTPMPSPAQ